jgi:hypothetical protein
MAASPLQVDIYTMRLIPERNIKARTNLALCTLLHEILFVRSILNKIGPPCSEVNVDNTIRAVFQSEISVVGLKICVQVPDIVLSRIYLQVLARIDALKLTRVFLPVRRKVYIRIGASGTY